MQFRVVLLWDRSQTSADGDSVHEAVSSALHESRSLQLACAEQKTIAMVVFQRGHEATQSMDVVAAQTLSDFLIASPNAVVTVNCSKSTFVDSGPPRISEADVTWGVPEMASLFRMKPAVVQRTLRLHPARLPAPSRKVGRNYFWIPSDVMAWLRNQQSPEDGVEFKPDRKTRGRRPNRLPGA